MSGKAFRHAAVLLLLLLGTPWTASLPTANAADGVRFRVAENDFVRYAIETIRLHDSSSPDRAREGQVDDVAGFHGRELDDSGRRVNRATNHLQMLYVPYVFWLPKGRRPGKREPIEEVLPQTWRMAPIEVSGWFERREDPERRGAEGGASMVVVGQVTFRPAPGDTARDGLTYRSLVEGSLTWSTQFDLERGLVTAAGYTLKWSSRRAIDDRPAAMSFVDPSERTFDTRVRLTLDRVLTHRYASFQADVDAAVESGLGLLLARQRPKGMWDDSDPAGMTALVLLTLLDGGVAPEHAAVERGFAWLLRQQPWAGRGTSRQTYATGLCMMALEARRIPTAERAARRRGEQPEFRERVLETAEQAFMRRSVSALLAAAEDRPISEPVATERARPLRWGYDLTEGRYANAREWDNSNTQYAVLGLESAARCGVAVPRSAWLGIAQHFLGTQVGDGPAPRTFALIRSDAESSAGATRRGSSNRYAKAKDRRYAPFLRTARSRGWHYHEPHHPGPGVSPASLCYGSMTATGIASLAIARARLADTRRRSDRALLREIDQAIVDGFVSLDDMFTVWEHPQYEGWYLYYLYALERAGMLTGIQRFGEHDWYWEGAVQLLSRIKPSGRSRGAHRGWSYHIGEVGSTCFAILFLKRGTVPVVTPR